MTKNKEVFGYVTAFISNGSFIVATQSELDALLYTLTLIVGLVAGLLSVAYTAVKWYQNARDLSSDGGRRITIDELKDGIEVIREEIENVDKN